MVKRHGTRNPAISIIFISICIIFIVVSADGMDSVTWILHRPIRVNFAQRQFILGRTEGVYFIFDTCGQCHWRFWWSFNERSQTYKHAMMSSCTLIFHFFDVSTIKEAMLFKLLPSSYQAKTWFSLRNKFLSTLLRTPTENDTVSDSPQIRLPHQGPFYSS